MKSSTRYLYKATSFLIRDMMLWYVEWIINRNNIDLCYVHSGFPMYFDSMLSQGTWIIKSHNPSLKIIVKHVRDQTKRVRSWDRGKIEEGLIEIHGRGRKRVEQSQRKKIDA